MYVITNKKIYIYTHTDADVSIHICMHICACMHACMHAFAELCMRAHFVCVCVHLNKNKYARVMTRAFTSSCV